MKINGLFYYFKVVYINMEDLRYIKKYGYNVYSCKLKVEFSIFFIFG